MKDCMNIDSKKRMTEKDNLCVSCIILRMLTAVLQLLYCTVVTKRDLSHDAKLSVYRSVEAQQIFRDDETTSFKDHRLNIDSREKKD